MRYTKRTEYGVVCMIHMAKQGEGNWMTIKELAKIEDYPVPYMEKIFQSLRQAKLVTSHQGNHGGYSLARAASEISLKQIIDALEGSTFDVFCDPEVRDHIVCNHICMCGAKPVWKRTKEILDHFYGSISLETLAKDQAQVQNLIPNARMVDL